MKIRHFAGVALAVTALCCMAGTCLPALVGENEPPSSDDATQLGVGLNAPTGSRTVSVGDPVRVAWSVFNRTESPGTLDVVAIRRSDLSESLLLGGAVFSTQTFNDSLDWDTSSFVRGEYSIEVRVRAGSETATARNDARITLDEPPTLVFTAPDVDVALAAEPNSDNTGPGTAKLLKDGLTAQEVRNSIAIRYRAFDPDGNGVAEIGLDPDGDPNSGNEVVLEEPNLPRQQETLTFNLTRTVVRDLEIDPGEYNYYAVISDDLSDPRFVPGLATITIPELPDEPAPIELAITDPNADIEFLTATPLLTVRYTLEEPNDVLIDIKVDTDENRTNGNERTILSQRLVEEGTTEGTFEWNGNDFTGAPLPDNIYQLFIVVNTGAGQPETADSDGLVFRRNATGKPLIAMLQPSSDSTSSLGAFVSVVWRDDTPDGAPTVRLTIDDDPNPAETTETGTAEREILAGRAGPADGVQDTFAFQIPADVAPGTYYFFGYIDRDGSAPFEHFSVAPGRITVPDPNSN